MVNERTEDLVPDVDRQFQRLQVLEGEVLGMSEDFALSQYEVDIYGCLVEDLDPMHNEPDWEHARREWGGPIAIGTQVLAMAPAFLKQVGLPVADPMVTFDVTRVSRVRFVSPLRVDEQARAEVRLLAVRERASGWEVRTAIAVHPCEEGRPFMHAEIDSIFVRGMVEK